jgi:glucokinase-like ROK family protein
MRRLNRNRVLDLIRENGQISCAQICRSSNLSKATVSEIVKSLKKQNFVWEAGEGKSAGGRPPKLLSFNPKGRRIIGVDIDVSVIVVALIDLCGNIESKLKIAVPSDRKELSIAKVLVSHINKLRENSGIGTRNLLGVGVAMTGEVDESGVVLYSSGFGWRNVDLKGILTRYCGLPAFVDNRARAMALGEHWLGSGRGGANLIYVNVSDGVGSGIILDGNLYRGAFSRGGEIGHTTMVKGGPVCRCGKRGCLEALVSGPAIVRWVKERTGDKAFSNVPRKPDEILDAALKGDRLAVKALQHAGYYLGVAIAGLINTFDPESVVLSGYVINRSGGLLPGIVREQVVSHVFDSKMRPMSIEEGMLGENAGIIGAAGLVYQNLLKYPVVRV